MASQRGLSWNELNTKEKIVRVQHLERVLSGLTKHQIKEHFDMGDWVYNPEVDGKVSAPSICGTSACAAGWASLDPWFKRNGFSSRASCNWLEGVCTDSGDSETVTTFEQSFDQMSPEEFFGSVVNEYIFVNDDLVHHSGASAHKRVLKRVRGYIKLLQTVESLEKIQSKMDGNFIFETINDDCI